MKIALVHDYLVQYGGAERVLECFAELYPYAPIHTIVYDEKALGESFRNKEVRTSFLQSWPLVKRYHRIFPLLMPMAIEKFDFSRYEVILSDSSSFAKGIITGPQTLHICYMHTPMRYAWDDCQKYTSDFSFPRAIKRAVPFAMNYLRIWDRISSERVDKFIANSKFVARRIKKYYNKTAEIIHPPVNVNNFYMSNKTSDYFLMVGRLIAYKRHDIAIRAFNELKWPLKIVGKGPELKRLKKIARSNIEFVGNVSDADLAKYYSECKAFIFPQEEDFGIVAIEAMASGKPIIAFRGGDIPEHMEENKMGVFFERQQPSDIIQALKRFCALKFDSQYIRSKALKFDKESFKAKIKDYVERSLAEFKSRKKR